MYLIYQKSPLVNIYLHVVSTACASEQAALERLWTKPLTFSKKPCAFVAEINRRRGSRLAYWS